MRRRFFNNNIKNFDINDYLTIEALEDNLQVCFPNEDLMYGIDGLGWQNLVAGAYSPAISKGQTISFKGNVKPDVSNPKTFTITKRCNLLGNCMSMLFGDNAADNYSLEGKDYAFYNLFYGCTNIVNVSSNFLPATTLTNGCYSGMFQNCTRLTTAPELPATTLTNGCYSGMFKNCTRLTTAPALPATTLARYCYQHMFHDCSRLTTAPALPATTLTDECYGYMFYNCTNLTTAPELPATTLASYCYYDMFQFCTNLTVAPELPATTLNTSCYEGMFSYCTNLTIAPELPATTLEYYCYRSMFDGCKKLNYIKMLATDISASNCLNNWVGNVSSTGTFVKNPDMNSLSIGTGGIPSGWTVVNDGEESGGGGGLA